jgi:cytoskeletal protein CcmA (bactofilin family)
MFGKEPEGQEIDTRQTSILAQGCRFEGKADVKGTFRVEGEFKGTIETPENLIIGKTGVVHANVKVKNAIIGGQLFGNIAAEAKIELQSGSHIEGDIRTKRLVVDEGVFFEGNCSMGGGKAASAASTTTGTTAATPAPSPASHAASPLPPETSRRG